MKTESQKESNRRYMRARAYSNSQAARRQRETTPYLYLMWKAKHRAKMAGLDFDLTTQWAESRWTGRCEVTGAPFVLGTKKNGPYSASIDRIDSSKGYTQDNARFVLWAVNRLKGDTGDDVMREIARLIVSGPIGKWND